jgi:hypothetical protein
VVVDADVDELPADSSLMGPAIPMDTMANAADPPEFLDVEVEEISRTLALVADDRRLGDQLGEPLESTALEDRRHRGSRHPQATSDLDRGLASVAELLDPPLASPRRPQRHSPRPTRPIRQAGSAVLPVPLAPAIDGPDTHARGLGRVLCGPPEPQYALDQELAGERGRLGVRMESHLRPSVESG